MKSVGIILARLQPIHNGHLALIEKSLKENTETYVFIGSADKFNMRNPLPINLRMMLAKEAAKEVFNWDEATCNVSLPYVNDFDQAININRTLKFIPLDDLTDESDNSHDWGFYLYSKIVSETMSPNFTIYYSDGFEIITTWFPGFIMRNNVSLSLLARGTTVDGISATKIREYIMNGDTESYKNLEKYVPKCVLEKANTIREHIQLSKLIK